MKNPLGNLAYHHYLDAGVQLGDEIPLFLWPAVASLHSTTRIHPAVLTFALGQVSEAIDNGLDGHDLIRLVFKLQMYAEFARFLFAFFPYSLIILMRKNSQLIVFKYFFYSLRGFF